MIGIPTHIIFLLIRSVYVTIRSFIWWLFDYCTVFNSYETSAHVERILWRSKFNYFDLTTPRTFFSWHERFDHPEIVLGDKYILICLTQKSALFAKMPQSIWHYTSDKYPFFWTPCFQESLETVTMPLSSLHRLADKLGGIKTPAILISNEGRCGSTLLTNLMYYSNRKVLSLSEPDMFEFMHSLTPYRKKMGKEFDRLLRSVAILAYKPVTEAEAIVIKMRITSTQLMEPIAETSPEIKHVYIRRKSSLKTVQSWERTFQGVGSLKVYAFLARHNLLEFLLTYVFPVTEFGEKTHKLAFKFLDMKNNMFDIMIVPWSINVLAYVNFSKKYTGELVNYEDLIGDPQATIRRLYKLLKNVEPVTIEDSINEGMKRDSQKDTPFATATRSNGFTEYTPEVKKRVDAYLDALGLPHLT